MKRLIRLSFRNKDLPPFSCEFAGADDACSTSRCIAWLTVIWVLLWSSPNRPTC